jgi:hypothetical protein
VHDDPAISLSLQDPLSFFPSESDAAVAQRATDFRRLNDAAVAVQGLSAPPGGTGADVAADYGRIQEALREVETRSAAAMETVQDIEQRLGPLAALQELRRDIDERFEALSALAETVTIKIATLKTEAVVWEDLRAQLRDTERAIKQSVADSAALEGVLRPLQTLAGQLASEFSRIQDAARETERRTLAAAETMGDVETRLGPLHDLSRHADQRLDALSALADVVAAREKALQDQNGIIEHAVVEAGRVADLVDALDARMATLKDGNDLLDRAEAQRQRLDAVTAETAAQLERREQLRNELARELVRVEAEVQSVAESSRRQVEVSKADAAILEDTRAQIRETALAVKQSLAEAASIRGALDPLHAQAARLTGEYARLQDALREAEERSASAAEARLRRLEAVAAETTAQLERRERLREDLAHELDDLDARRFTLPVLPGDRPTSHEPVDVRGESSLPGMDWPEPWTPPRRPSTTVMTRVRVPRTVSVLKQGGAGVGLAVLVVVGFFAMRPVEKPAPIERQRLPAQALPPLDVSVPALSGTSVIPNESNAPAIVTRSPIASRPPATAVKPPATAARQAPAGAPATAPSAEYFGTLAIESTPPGATVFVDRQAVGQTPLELPRVRAGSHAVRVEREGYQRWTAAVNVPASTVTHVSVKLDAESAR